MKFSTAVFAPNAWPGKLFRPQVLLALIMAWLFVMSNNSRANEGRRKMSTGLKVASVQFPIQGNQSSAQLLAKIEGYVKQAVKKDVELVVFPEFVALDAWPIPIKEEKPQHLVEPNEKSDREIVQQIAKITTPDFFAGVKRLARKYNIAILAGSAPRFEKTLMYNTAIMVFPDGRQFQQDKINLTKWERDVGFLPGKQLMVTQTPWGQAAILICYDTEFPDLSAALMPYNLSLIFVPSMTESQQGLNRVRCTAQARAIEHHAYVILSGTVGEPSPDWQHFGQSAILSPSETPFPNLIIEGERNRSDMVIQNLDLNCLAQSKKASEFHPAADAQKAGRTFTIVTQSLLSK